MTKEQNELPKERLKKTVNEQNKNEVGSPRIGLFFKVNSRQEAVILLTTIERIEQKEGKFYRKTGGVEDRFSSDAGNEGGILSRNEPSTSQGRLRERQEGV